MFRNFKFAVVKRRSSLLYIEKIDEGLIKDSGKWEIPIRNNYLQKTGLDFSKS